MVGMVLMEKYVIQSLLARGGMGEVYLAEHRGIGQKVAVKVLNRRFHGNDTVRQRFINEARSSGRLTHPNAVKTYDQEQLPDGTVYLIMEYVPGVTLSEHLDANGPLPLKRLLQLAMQLADVLLFAHQQGVVHRDLKPDNVMLIESSPGRFQAKVLDFGIAKLLGEQGQLTEAGMVFGTPEFMSPEQAEGIDVDHRTDIYAFGMLLYYMAVQALPFAAENKLVVLNKQIHEIAKAPSVLCPSVPIDQGLEAVIMKCIRKHREDRYQSFSEVLSDLDALEAGLPPLARSERAPQAIPDFISLDEESKTTNPDSVPVLLVPAPSADDPLARMFEDAPSLGTIPTVLSLETNPEQAFESNTGGSRKPSLELDALTPQAAEGFALGDDNEDGFSFGADLDVVGDDAPTPRTGPTGLGGLLVFIALALALGGAAFWFFSQREPGSSGTEQGADSEPELATDEVDAELTAQSNADVETEQTLAALPASTRVNSVLRLDAVSRLGAQWIDQRISAGELDAAAKMTDFAKKRWSAASTARTQAIEALGNRLAEVRRLSDAARKSARRLRCAEVEEAASSLSPLSEAAAQSAQQLAQKCRRELEAAPSRVD
jgi:serine/threonine protein kinase